jgi:hypothetical protein
VNEVPIPDLVARRLQIDHWPGYEGVFTRNQALGAWRNGTRVAKTAEDPSGDLTPLGSHGAVLGSIYAPEVGVGYFVEWDDKPKTAVFVVAKKLTALP